MNNEKTYTEDQKWSWMMIYCKVHGYASANPYLWQEAEDAFYNHYNIAIKNCDLCDQSDRCINNESIVVRCLPPASLRSPIIKTCFSCKHTIITMASLNKKYCIDCKKEWKLNESISGQ